MTLDKTDSVYFLGIGGIGMSALARFFLLQGKQVFGYDLTPTEITSQLMTEGAQIHFDENPNKIPSKIDLVIYTPAISKEHAEYKYFIENNIPLVKRSEILGMICSNYPTIAIAGTHGKTTTTAMITQLMLKTGILAFIGGISKNLNSNFICESNYKTLIAEADEFDRSFLTLHPTIAVITSIDADHLDIYGSYEDLRKSFQQFADQIKSEGALVIYDEIADQIMHPKKITYGFSNHADYQICNIQYFPTRTTFDLTINPHLISSPHHLVINISGKHNVLNATAALVACLEFSLWKDEKNDVVQLLEILKKHLSAFSGVKRRFDIRIQHNDFVYIDDYAHHPEEIKSFLDAVKKSFPTKKLTGIFQPHLYSRTKDFALEFAEALKVLDEIILLDIYPAREKPIAGITSNYLLSLIQHKNKKLINKEKLISYLSTYKPEILLTIGAGDIDKLVPLIESKFQ
jgi:UDP-N-acetylmuramate--alanine ligase